MGIDLYNHEKRYNSWKEQALKKDFIEEGLTKQNSAVLIKYVFDMEIGRNISSSNRKGSRSPARLNNLRQRLGQVLRMLQERGVSNILKVDEEVVSRLFSEMRSGRIKTLKGEQYKSVADYIKIFKAFWHWHIKVSRKDGKPISDITLDMDTSPVKKPAWVYLDDSQIKKVLASADNRYKPLFSFMYDSGARVSEALSIAAEDIYEDKGVVFVNIKDENSKTFGRKIKLILCGKDLIEYIKRSELKPQDKVFSVSPVMANRYLNELGKNVFGEHNSKAGEKFSNLTLYDFRHNSACFWVLRYKNNHSLMYRFGWKTEKYILYYTEFMGMKDLIQEDDLYVDVTKTELEKKIEFLNKRVEILNQEYAILDKDGINVWINPNKPPTKETLNQIIKALKGFKNDE